MDYIQNIDVNFYCLPAGGCYIVNRLLGLIMTHIYTQLQNLGLVTAISTRRGKRNGKHFKTAPSPSSHENNLTTAMFINFVVKLIKE